jgi:hypothetical protein
MTEQGNSGTSPSAGGADYADRMRTSTIITICDGDLDLHDDLEEAAAGFCFEDAIADYTTVLDSAGRFYRPESEDYSAWFVLDKNREPDPQFLREQLRLWISRTADVIDYGLADPGSADVPTLIGAIRNGRRTTPMPTLWSQIRKTFRR